MDIKRLMKPFAEAVNAAYERAEAEMERRGVKFVKGKPIAEAVFQDSAVKEAMRDPAVLEAMHGLVTMELWKLAPMFERLARTEAMLTAKMEHGELKGSEARLLRLAKFLSGSKAKPGHLQVAILIIDFIAAGYPQPDLPPAT
jgi:hypothetical protein